MGLTLFKGRSAPTSYYHPNSLGKGRITNVPPFASLLGTIKKRLSIHMFMQVNPIIYIISKISIKNHAAILTTFALIIGTVKQEHVFNTEMYKLQSVRELKTYLTCLSNAINIIML